MDLSLSLPAHRDLGLAQGHLLLKDRSRRPPALGGVWLACFHLNGGGGGTPVSETAGGGAGIGSENHRCRSPGRSDAPSRALGRQLQVGGSPWAPKLKTSRQGPWGAPASPGALQAPRSDGGRGETPALPLGRGLQPGSGLEQQAGSRNARRPGAPEPPHRGQPAALTLTDPVPKCHPLQVTPLGAGQKGGRNPPPTLTHTGSEPARTEDPSPRGCSRRRRCSRVKQQKFRERGPGPGPQAEKLPAAWPCTEGHPQARQPGH